MSIWLSLEGLAWLSLATATLIFVFLKVAWNGRPSTSVAHVLFDAERRR